MSTSTDQSGNDTEHGPRNFGVMNRWLRRKAENSNEPDEMVEPTPIYVSHRVRLLIILLTLAIVILVFRNLPTITSIVLLGSTVALILSFPVRFLQRYVSRKISILIVTITAFGGTILTISLAIPFFLDEINQFITSLPDTTEMVMERVNSWLGQIYDRGWMSQNPDQLLSDAQESLVQSAQTIFGTVLNNVVAALGATVNVVITMFGVLFVAIYLLIDIPKFKDSYIRLWAPKYRVDALVLWDTMGFSLSRFLGAQVVSMALQGVIVAIALMIIGVPYALVLGLVQAATAILPYIGAWIAFIPAFMIALTISWPTALGVAIIYLSINQIEGNLITPNLQGNAVKVHPILVFIGVIAGAQLFGLMGAILAVPAIAILRVFVEFFWMRLQVFSDAPTLLAIMRNDTVAERLGHRSGAAEDGEEQAKDNIDEIEKAAIDV